MAFDKLIIFLTNKLKIGMHSNTLRTYSNTRLFSNSYCFVCKCLESYRLWYKCLYIYQRFSLLDPIFIDEESSLDFCELTELYLYMSYSSLVFERSLHLSSVLNLGNLKIHRKFGRSGVILQNTKALDFLRKLKSTICYWVRIQFRNDLIAIIS